MIIMWRYRELISCPMPILLGSFEHNELKGYVTLFSTNYRLNILIDHDGNARIVSNIHNKSWLDHLSRICVSIINNRLLDLDYPDRALAYSMYYGGLVVTGVVSNNIYVISPDYVNKKKFFFYLTSWHDVSTNDLSKASLGDWISLQLSLREGLVDLFMSICKRSFAYRDKACVLTTSHGELFITNEENFPGGIRIYPDNNPFRHVVSIQP